MTCDRIRIGGTISGSTLTGGTLIESSALSLTTWGGMLGYPGRTGRNIPIAGRDGSYRTPGKAYAPRAITLSVAARDRNAAGIITTSRRQEFEDNMDFLLELIDGDAETFILERDMADGTTRWIECETIPGVAYQDGPIFGRANSARTLVLPLEASYPFWQSEVLHSQVVSGAGTIVNLGNARISNMILTFASNGVFTHSDTGDTITIAGATGAVTVDVGARTIVQAAVEADRLMTPSAQYWLRFGKGNNAVTRTGGNVTVQWRDSFF